MSSLFVVSCRFDPERPVIFDCLNGILEHHERPKVLVVDSGSPDKSYFDFCMERGIGIASIHNQLYSLGAFAYAQRHYPDIDYFYFLFDSVVVKANLEHFQARPVTVTRHWAGSDHGWGWDHDGTPLEVWGGQQLERMGVPMPSTYHGVMGPMMFVQRPVVEQLDRLGYWFTQTRSAFHTCAMERVTGIVLEHLGYDVTDSIQGEHRGHFDPYPEDTIMKIDMARA